MFGGGLGLRLWFDVFVFLGRRSFVAGLDGACGGLRSALGRGERRVVGGVRGGIGAETRWDR